MQIMSVISYVKDSNWKKKKNQKRADLERFSKINKINCIEFMCFTDFTHK